MHVAVVGAGIIGCAVAHELAARGVRVDVFDRRGVARGASWASAGVLAPWIEAHHRGPLLEMCVDSLSMWDSYVERLRTDGAPAFEYGRPGTLDAALTDDSAARLNDAAAELSASGVRADWIEGAAARALEPCLSPDIVGALRIEGHGFVEMPGVVEAISVAGRMRGAVFHQPADVTKIEAAPGGRVRLRIDDATLTFDHVVIAGGAWANRLKPGTPGVKPIKGQLVRLSFDLPPASHVLWSDVCYMVPWRDGTLLVGATMEDVGFDERTTASGVHELLAAAVRLVPAAADATFVDVRAGLRPAPVDESIPFVGPAPTLANVTVATGHFRNGVMLAPWTAARVAALVL